MKTCRTNPVHASTPVREELALYMPLVCQVVASVLRKVPPNVLREDLMSAGMFGLSDALRKSADRGPAFAWYARTRIRGGVVDELRAEDWLTRRARHRATRAQAEGTGGNATVVGFDDLSEAQAGGVADDSTATPEQQVDQRMERRILERAVMHLPERECNIVGWHYFDDVPFKTIAARLGVSQPRVSQLHSRAIGLLRATMIEQSGAQAA
jgi:RNA polymerase sigma factor FliA